MTLAKIEKEENISSERMEKALKVLELIENGTFEQLFLKKFLEGIKCNKDLTDFIQTNNTTEEGALLWIILKSMFVTTAPKSTTQPNAITANGY